MKILQNSFNKYLNKNYFFEKKPIIAVAVSGGPDSMCLIYLLNNWINENKGRMIALIVDHKIRKESRNESYLIKDEISEIRWITPNELKLELENNRDIYCPWMVIALYFLDECKSDTKEKFNSFLKVFQQ